jgi:hypothetical protein
MFVVPVAFPPGRKTLYHFTSDWIGDYHKHDRDGLRHSLCRKGRRPDRRDKDIYTGCDELLDNGRKPVVLIGSISMFKPYVTPIDIAERSETVD